VILVRPGLVVLVIPIAIVSGGPGLDLLPARVVIVGDRYFPALGEGFQVFGHGGHRVLAAVVADGTGAARLQRGRSPPGPVGDRDRIAITAHDRGQQFPVAGDHEVLHPAATLIRPTARDATTPGPVLEVSPGQVGPAGLGKRLPLLLRSIRRSLSRHVALPESRDSPRLNKARCKIGSIIPVPWLDRERAAEAKSRVW